MAHFAKTVGRALTLFPKDSWRKKQAPVAIPDEDAIRQNAKRMFAKRAMRGSRQSTILDQETLG